MFTRPCRLFGDRHLWTTEIATLAEERAGSVLLQNGEYVRWMHVHLHEISAAGSALARIQLACADNERIAVAAVRGTPEAALDEAFCLLRTHLPTSPVAVA